MFFSLAPTRRCSMRRDPCWMRQRPVVPVPVPRFEMELDEDQFLDNLFTPLNFLSALASEVEGTNAQRQKKRKEEAEKAVAEKRARFEVKLNVEGYKPDELNVKLEDNNTLVVSGKHESEDDNGFVSRNFVRRWTVPEDVQMEEMSCNLNAKDNTILISAPRKVELPALKDEKIIPIKMVEDSTKDDEEQKKKEDKDDGSDNVLEKIADEGPVSHAA